MNDLETFVITVDNPGKEDLDNLSKLMAAAQDETVAYINKLAEELNVDSMCAGDVWYLRTRSRWTQELEEELIRLHQAGTPPNMCDYGVQYMEAR